MIKTNIKGKGPVQVIAVTGSKGGIGKTQIAVNLALSLSALQKKVLLMDGCLGLGSINVLLNLPCHLSFSDVLLEGCQLKDILIDGPGGIKIVPASSGNSEMMELSSLQLAGLIHAFSDYSDDLDYMVIDTASGMSHAVFNFARASTAVIVVIENATLAMHHAYTFVSMLVREHGIRDFQIIVNCIDDSRKSRAVFRNFSEMTDNLQDLHLHYLGYLPRDSAITKAEDERKAVVEAYPESTSASKFKRIAERIETWPNASHHAGHLSFFIERLVNHEFSSEDLIC